MKYQLLKSSDFIDWYGKQNRKTKAIIDARFDRIQLDGHFGFTNQFDGLIELKWTSGMRIYTFVHDQVLVVALYGGNKNGQDKDIKKAKKIREDYLREA
jgi:putative addiction module killer protein